MLGLGTGIGLAVIVAAPPKQIVGLLTVTVGLVLTVKTPLPVLVQPLAEFVKVTA